MNVRLHDHFLTVTVIHYVDQLTILMSSNFYNEADEIRSVRKGKHGWWLGGGGGGGWAAIHMAISTEGLGTSAPRPKTGYPKTGAVRGILITDSFEPAYPEIKTIVRFILVLRDGGFWFFFFFELIIKKIVWISWSVF